MVKYLVLLVFLTACSGGGEGFVFDAGTVEAVPLDTVEDVPLDTVEDVPLDTVEDVPLDTVEDVPLDTVEAERLTPLRQASGCFRDNLLEVDCCAVAVTDGTSRCIPLRQVLPLRGASSTVGGRDDLAYDPLTSADRVAEGQPKYQVSGPWGNADYEGSGYLTGEGYSVRYLVGARTYSGGVYQDGNLVEVPRGSRYYLVGDTTPTDAFAALDYYRE
jgi:hypothetical protein